MNVFLKLQYQINKTLDGLSDIILKGKFSNTNRCLAFDFDAKTNDYTKRCEKISKHKYCKAHNRLLVESCEKYHFYNNRSLFDVSEDAVIEAELHCRKVFCKRFSIVSDLNHSVWEKKLKRKLSAYYKNANEFLDYIKNEISYGTPDLFSVKKSIYNLEVGLMLENKIKSYEFECNDYDFEYDNSKSNKMHSKLCRYKKNLFLFEMFYSRNSLSKINYLDYTQM